MTDEVPKDAPRLTVGKKLCAVWEQRWTTKTGEARHAVAMSEIEPTEYASVEGRDVVVAWRRKFKGLNLSLPDRTAWIQLTEDLNRVFGRPLQKPLVDEGAKRAVGANGKLA